METEFESLKKRHYELISSYYWAINKVTFMPLIKRDIWLLLEPDIPIFRRIQEKIEKDIILKFLFRKSKGIFFKPVVSFFVEWHIKKKIGIIIKTYARLEQTLDNSNSDNKKKIEWLKSTQDGLRKFIGTLSTFSSIENFFRSTWFFLSGLLIAYFGVSNIFELMVELYSVDYDPFFILKFAGRIFIIIVYLFIFIFPSFGYKRQHIFCEILLKPNENEEKSLNIYQVENNLFQILGKNKPKEIPIDFILYSTICFLFGVLIIGNLILTPTYDISFYLKIIIIIFFFYLSIFLWWTGFSREIN